MLQKDHRYQTLTKIPNLYLGVSLKNLSFRCSKCACANCPDLTPFLMRKFPYTLILSWSLLRMVSISSCLLEALPHRPPVQVLSHIVEIAHRNPIFLFVSFPFHIFYILNNLTQLYEGVCQSPQYFNRGTNFWIHILSEGLNLSNFRLQVGYYVPIHLPLRQFQRCPYGPPHCYMLFFHEVILPQASTVIFVYYLQPVQVISNQLGKYIHILCEVQAFGGHI